LIETPTHLDGKGEPEDLTYVDAIARQLASEPCPRCSRVPNWKTAAMLYEGLEWKYYYCYDCRRWYVRHFRYRYAFANLDDYDVVSMLTRRLEADREFLEAQLENMSWFRRKLAVARSFFQRFLPL